MKRRDFICKGVLSGLILASASAVLSSCKKDEDEPEDEDESGNGDGLTIDMSTDEFVELQKEGEYAYINDIIVINAAGTYIALDRKCTHMGCNVVFNADDTKVTCPCHGSIFSTAGDVENGPANDPLVSYPVSQDGDILTITV